MPAAVRRSPLTTLRRRWIGKSVGMAYVATEMPPHVKEIYPDEGQLLASGALTLVAHKTDGAVTVGYEAAPLVATSSTIRRIERDVVISLLAKADDAVTIVATTEPLMFSSYLSRSGPVRDHKA